MLFGKILGGGEGCSVQYINIYVYVRGETIQDFKFRFN